MLFLAVFCGFLAENFREHLVERRQEKEYRRDGAGERAVRLQKLNGIVPRRAHVEFCH